MDKPSKTDLLQLFFAANRFRLIASAINWRLSYQGFYAIVQTVFGGFPFEQHHFPSSLLTPKKNKTKMRILTSYCLTCNWEWFKIIGSKFVLSRTISSRRMNIFWTRKLPFPKLINLHKKPTQIGLCHCAQNKRNKVFSYIKPSILTYVQ